MGRMYATTLFSFVQLLLLAQLLSITCAQEDFLSLHDCGRAKSCLRSPGDCSRARSCDWVISLRALDNSSSVVIELYATVDRDRTPFNYLALAFFPTEQDQHSKIGGDATICSFGPNKSSRIDLGRYESSANLELRNSTSADSVLRLEDAFELSSGLYCRVIQSRSSITSPTDVNALNDTRYIELSTGSYVQQGDGVAWQAAKRSFDFGPFHLHGAFANGGIETTSAIPPIVTSTLASTVEGNANSTSATATSTETISNSSQAVGGRPAATVGEGEDGGQAKDIFDVAMDTTTQHVTTGSYDENGKSKDAWSDDPDDGVRTRISPMIVLFMWVLAAVVG